MLNQINIMGRLVRNPEVKTFNSGHKVTNIRIACDRDYTSGEDRKTDFIDCVAWGRTGEFINKYFNKGRMIVISGSLQIREWNDKEGKKHTKAEISIRECYFGDSKRSESASEVPIMEELPDDDGDLPWKMDDDDEDLPL